MINQVELTTYQRAALLRVCRVGRAGIGEFGGIRRPTANVLRCAGLIRVEHEYVRGNLREFAYPTDQGNARFVRDMCATNGGFIQ